MGSMNGYALKLAAPEENRHALQSASADLRADREIVRLGMGQNGCALQFAAEVLKADREIVLVAVAQDGLALKFAAPHLRVDRKVVLTAAAQTCRALQFAPAARRWSCEVCWLPWTMCSPQQTVAKRKKKK